MSNIEKIDLELGGFSASFRPQLGGNLVRLYHQASDTEVLRTPPDDESYQLKPEIWGMPVLMPPNRIRDGRFVYQDRIYQLPVNEPAPRHNNLHGLLLRREWSFRQIDGSTVEMFLSYPGSAAGEGWMHAFEAVLRYEFFENSVRQKLTFTNKSDLAMPLMAGFHSAFNLPDGAEFYLDASQECRMLDDLRKIVNGQTESLPPWQRFRTVKSGERLLGHCAMLHGSKEYAEFIIRYPAKNCQMRYQLPPPWREWVIWNNMGTENFVCAEPQSCRIDAMNIDLTPADAGVIELAPGNAQTFEACIVIESQ